MAKVTGGRRGSAAALGVRVPEARELTRLRSALSSSKANNKFLVELADVLHPLEDITEIRKVVADLLGRHLDAQRVAILALEPTGIAVLAAEYTTSGMPAYPAQVRISDFGSQAQDLANGTLDYIINDISQIPHIKSDELEAWRSLGIASMLAIPTRRDGPDPVYLAVHSSEPRIWSAETIELVQNVADLKHEAVERARASHELRDSERRWRTLIEGIPQLVWRCHGNGNWTWSSPQWQSFTGLSGLKSQKQGWLAALHPDDRAIALDAWKPSETVMGYHAEFRVYDAGHRQYCWFRNRATPVRDDSGDIVEFLGTSTYIDDIQELHAQQLALLAELQHRVRNTLSVIRSIARKTAETSDSVDDYAMHLDGRIEAFARSQASVTRNPTAGVDLAGLIADELSAYGAREGRGLTVEGPPIRLKAKPAESITLAIHELTTNAVKYGALSRDGMTLRIAWSLRPRGAGEDLVILWEESGMPHPVTPPSRKGFGTDLLKRSLAYNLGAFVEQRFESDGVKVKIAIPDFEKIALTT